VKSIPCRMTGDKSIPLKTLLTLMGWVVHCEISVTATTAHTPHCNMVPYDEPNAHIPVHRGQNSVRACRHDCRCDFSPTGVPVVAGIQPTRKHFYHPAGSDYGPVRCGWLRPPYSDVLECSHTRSWFSVYSRRHHRAPLWATRHSSTETSDTVLGLASFVQCHFCLTDCGGVLVNRRVAEAST
jgi:hypothetical protein